MSEMFMGYLVHCLLNQNWDKPAHNNDEWSPWSILSTCIPKEASWIYGIW